MMPQGWVTLCGVSATTSPQVGLTGVYWGCITWVLGV
jgi:hypothetical protein